MFIFLQLQTLKGNLERAAGDVETTRSELTSMKKEIKDKSAK